MSETLSFPGLGLEFELSRTAFTVAGQPIYWYGVLIAVAFLLGAVYTLRRVKAFGLDGDRMMDAIIAGVILGVVCARLYYVIFSGDSTYFESFLNLINIRKGGIAIYGGVIGALLAAVLMSRVRNFKLLPTLDAVSGGLLLGQAIGRWGNFVNIEAFGSNTTLPWGMTSPSIEWYLQQNQTRLAGIGVTVDPSMPVHPTFLYESIWCLLGFLLIAWYTKRRRFDGELSLIYIGWYGLGRSFIEGLRTDPLLIGTVRISQMVAILCMAVSVVALIIVHSRIRRANDPDYLRLHFSTEDGQAIIAGTFYKMKGEDKTDKPDEKELVGSGEAAAEIEHSAVDQTEPEAEEAQTREETPAPDMDQEVPAKQREEADNGEAD